MSESSIDKTKRKIISAMQKYRPEYQTSFFFDSESRTVKELDEEDELGLGKKLKIEINIEVAHAVLLAFSNIRRPVSETFPDSVCIWWLRVLYRPQIQYMFQIFSTQKLDENKMEEILFNLKYFPDYRMQQRRFSELRLERWCRTIKNQKLHDIKRFYGKEHLRRWAVTNKKAAK